MKRKAFMIIAVMAAAMLAGCNGNGSASAPADSDVYMSQFGEYENGDRQSTDGGFVYADGSDADGLSMTTNGEKMFEETLSTGAPAVVEAEESDEVKDAKADSGKKSKAKASTGVATVSDPLVTQESVVATVSETAATAGNTTVARADNNSSSDQTITNPTENTSTSDNGGAAVDYGSGISQSCDDDSANSGGAGDAGSEETIYANFE